jgi:hypothetical protein
MKLKFGIVGLGLLTFTSIVALAQEGSGVISGTIYGPEGETVSYLWIRAVDADSAEQARAESNTDGEYRLPDLAPGKYTLEVSTPCCAYLNYDSEEIVVDEGRSVEFDVSLEEGDSFNTVGDDPGVIAAALRGEAVIPDEPSPRMPNGRPDLSGVWLVGDDPFADKAEGLPWAEALAKERQANYAIDHPHNQCLPGGPPIPGGAAPFVAKFVHKDDLLVILFEDYPGFRQVFLDGRNHPEYPNPSWVGHSIGRWDGDVLIVDTIGFNDRGWMNSYPRSEELHIIERYSRPEFGRIDLELTIEDPNVFAKSWQENASYYLVPHIELIEYVCENNKWAGGAGN